MNTLAVRRVFNCRSETSETYELSLTNHGVRILVILVILVLGSWHVFFFVIMKAQKL